MSLPGPTERLEFRSWREDDLELAMQLWGDPNVTALVAKVPLDRGQVEERLRRELVNAREHGVQYWPIFMRNTGAFAGCTGLRPRDPEAKIFEMGFYIAPTFWGLGLATEAAKSVVTHAFENLGASALFAGHHPENQSSRNVLTKLGFIYTHDELYPPTGLNHPAYLLKP